jgi:hypothetical protein
LRDSKVISFILRNDVNILNAVIIYEKIVLSGNEARGSQIEIRFHDAVTRDQVKAIAALYPKKFVPFARVRHASRSTIAKARPVKKPPVKRSSIPKIGSVRTTTATQSSLVKNFQHLQTTDAPQDNTAKISSDERVLSPVSQSSLVNMFERLQTIETEMDGSPDMAIHEASTAMHNDSRFDKRCEDPDVKFGGNRSM